MKGANNFQIFFSSTQKALKEVEMCCDAMISEDDFRKEFLSGGVVALAHDGAIAIAHVEYLAALTIAKVLGREANSILLHHNRFRAHSANSQIVLKHVVLQDFSKSLRDMTFQTGVGIGRGGTLPSSFSSETKKRPLITTPEKTTFLIEKKDGFDAPANYNVHNSTDCLYVIFNRKNRGK